jgi:2-iminobutanoate/2-iminopropanoate deaminase
MRIARPMQLAAALVTLTHAAGAAERSYVGASSADKPGGAAFSQAVRVGDTLYLAGTLGLTADRKVPEDVAVEAKNALDAVKKTLAEAGMTMDDLVSVQVFCSDVALYDAWNGVYRGYFTKEFPARAFIGSGKLLFGAHFEIQGIAVKR